MLWLLLDVRLLLFSLLAAVVVGLAEVSVVDGGVVVVLSPPIYIYIYIYRYIYTCDNDAAKNTCMASEPDLLQRKTRWQTVKNIPLF